MHRIDKLKEYFQKYPDPYKEDLNPEDRPWSQSRDWLFHHEDLMLSGQTNDIILPLKRISLTLQGGVPSCVPSTFDSIVQQATGIKTAIRYLWYFSRRNHGLENAVTGTYISSCLHAANKHGYSPDHLWPYTENYDDIVTVPGIQAMQYADDNMLITSNYYRTYGRENKKTAYQLHMPLMVGFNVGSTFLEYEGKEDDSLHSLGNDKQGGHCVAAVGVRYRYRNGSLREEHAIINFWNDWGGSLTDAEDNVLPSQCAWIDEDVMDESIDCWAVKIL